jgi:hypothetical protein
VAKLDEIIDGASDPSVTVADLLRKAAVVAHRIRATELTEWIKREQGGYPDRDVPLPTYRGPFSVPVFGHYATYGRERLNVQVDAASAPEEWKKAFEVELRQPLAQIEEMAGSKGENVVLWTPSLVSEWNRLEERGEVMGLEDHSLLSARRLIPRRLLVGAIDAVKNALQAFALELQDADDPKLGEDGGPKLGEPGGPTVEDAAVRQSVVHITNNIFGAGASLAMAPGVTQNMTVVMGDLDSLLNAAKGAGLTDPEALAELKTAAASEDKPSKLRAFVDKAASGAYSLTTGIGTQVAKDVLTPMIEQFLGHH